MRTPVFAKMRRWIFAAPFWRTRSLSATRILLLGLLLVASGEASAAQTRERGVETAARARPPETAVVSSGREVKASGPSAPLPLVQGLTWSTYVGGSGRDWGAGVAVDSAGNVFVTGYTDSAGWVSGGFDTTFNGGIWPFGGDAFVAKLSGNGSHFWSTYLGGDSLDYGNGIAVDREGNVFVTGYTYSSGWVSGGFDTTYDGGEDVFVVELSRSGSHLWSTYLGGVSSDRGHGIAVGGAGNVFVTGYTDSSGWVSGGSDTTLNGRWDTFVAELSGSGAHLWSTYLGGSSDDFGLGIAVDSAENVFVTGETWSSGWVSGGFDTTLDGYKDAFAVELSGSGTHLWSTYLGGGGSDVGLGIAVDGAGSVFVTGETLSSDWVSGGFDTTHNGGNVYVGGDAFVVKLSGSGAHLWSTYLGGSDGDGGHAITTDGAGNVFVTGSTKSSGWVSGGFDTIYNGSDDAFVAKLSGNGSHVWSTYLGGNGSDEGNGIAVDGAGNVFVTGETSSSGWVTGGFDTTFNGGYCDAFVAKIRGRIGPSNAAPETWQLY